MALLYCISYSFSCAVGLVMDKLKLMIYIQTKSDFLDNFVLFGSLCFVSINVSATEWCCSIVCSSWGFFTIILARFHAAYLKPSTMVGILFLFQIMNFFFRNSNNILMIILFLFHWPLFTIMYRESPLSTLLLSTIPSLVRFSNGTK